MVGNCTIEWAQFNGFDSFKYLFYPGQLKIRCTQTYNNASGGKKIGPITTPVYTMNVPKPDGYRVLTNPASGRFGQDIRVVMQVTCKGQDSIYFSAYMQEKNDKVMRPNGPGRIEGSWVPTVETILDSQNSGPKLRIGYEGLGKMYDIRQLNIGGPMDQPRYRVGMGGTVVTFDQSLRLILFDPCGKPLEPVNLGSKKVTIKVSPTDPTTIIMTQP